MNKFSSVSKKEKKQSKEENENDLTEKLFLSLLGEADEKNKSEFRVTGIYGAIDEEKCCDAVYSLLILKQSGKNLKPKDPEDPESPLVVTYTPIDFLISTYGGAASEMFAVYDVMRRVKVDCPIRTFGFGKVMSAGVLLLAAGTKGERHIGANCRIMIHGVISGQHGHLSDVENEFEEAKMTQKQYVSALAESTDMTAAYIKKLINRKTNVYLDAQQALELGIVDKII